MPLRMSVYMHIPLYVWMHVNSRAPIPFTLVQTKVCTYVRANAGTPDHVFACTFMHTYACYAYTSVYMYERLLAKQNTCTSMFVRKRD